MISRAHIPNLLTLGRVVAVPIALLVILLLPGAHGLLFFIFVIAATTDFFDGYLARKWNVTSPLGAMLDPIADKLLVALMLLYFMQHYGLALLPVAAMILRELYIAGLREFLANKQVALPVSQGGKLKTALQLVGIGLLLFAIWLQLSWASWLGVKLIWLAAAVSVASAVQYTRACREHF